MLWGMHNRGMRERDVSVDALRVVGMLLVIWFHIGELWWGAERFFPMSVEDFMRFWESTRWSPWYVLQLLGDHAVPLFLFISGFGLGTYLPQANLNWYRSRLGKILIPFWISVLLLSPIMWWVGREYPEIIRMSVTQQFSVSRMLSSALLLQNWSRETFNAPVAAWWFVPLIVQLYFVYPFLRLVLLRLTKKQYIKVLLVGGGLWNLMVMWLLWTIPGWYFLWFSGMSYVMVFGLGLWWAYYRMAWPWWAGLGLLLAGWVLRIVSGEMLFVSEMLIGWGWFVWLYGWFKSREREHPAAVQTLGVIGKRWSYWVYLWHQPLLFLVVSILYLIFRER